MMKYKVVKKFVRGKKQGNRITEIIELPKRSSIYNFLWDAVEKFDRNKINYVIEWYRPNMA